MNGIPSFFLGIRVHYYIRAGKAVNGAKIIKKLVINNGLWRINANHFFSTLGLPKNRPIIKVKHKNEDTHTFCGILRDQHILFIQEMYLTRTFFSILFQISKKLLIFAVRMQ